jgi:hypothetical protein
MLITTIAEFKQYLAIDVNTSMDTLSPYITEAEMLYILPLLGKEFMDEVQAAYTASKLDPEAPGYAALPASIALLLPYIHRPLAYYAQLQSISHLSVTFGDMGIRQHRAEDSDAAPRWKEDKLMFQALHNGDIYADVLLEYLELNASPTTYGTWFASSYNTKNSGYLVYGTAIASRHIDINNSRRVFTKLIGKLREVETRYIPKLIGQDQYDELVTQLKTGGSGIPTEPNLTLIAKLQPIICRRALYMQLPFMKVQINENGIFTHSGTDDIYKLGQIATDADVKILRDQLMNGDSGYLADEAEIRQFILDNIESYPLIKASTVYTVQPDPGPTWRPPVPGPDSKWFGV